MKFSIVLPTYNEKGNIVRLIKVIQSICKINNLNNFEIIVVDDNSPDKTAEYCQKAFKKQRNIKVYTRLQDKGLASAVRFGINKSKGERIIIMDTDFNHDPGVIPTMLKLSGKYNLVIGSRFIKNGGMQNKKRYYLSKIYNLFIKIVSHVDFTDFLSGFFCIKSKDLKKMNLDYIFRGYGEYFIRLLVLSKKFGFKHTEVPAYYKNRKYGVSKSKFVSMMLTYTLTTFEVISVNKYKPNEFKFQG